MASAFASDAKTYMDLSGADNMMKDMMTAVVMHKPEDPVDFLIDWLVRAHTAPRPDSALRIPRINVVFTRSARGEDHFPGERRDRRCNRGEERQPRCLARTARHCRSRLLISRAHGP